MLLKRSLQMALCLMPLLLCAAKDGKRILEPVTVKAENVKPFAYTTSGKTTDVVGIGAETLSSVTPLPGTVKVADVKNGEISFIFRPTSPIWWSLKGVQINLEKPVSGNYFEGLLLDFSLKPGKGLHSIWIGFLDDQGYWWDILDTAAIVKVGKDDSKTYRLDFEKQLLRRSLLSESMDWSKHGQTGKITALAIYFRVHNLPGSGDVYEGTFKNIQWVRKYTDNRLKYDIDPNFPLQWKSTTMREDGTMLVDGKPFFPLMAYSCIGTDLASATHQLSCYTGPTDEKTLKARFKAFKDVGFNTLFSYTALYYGLDAKPGWTGAGLPAGKDANSLRLEGAKRFLDFCQDSGLKAMIGGNAIGGYTLNAPLNPEDRSGSWEKVKKNISRTMLPLKNHPALLMWYMWDEPSEAKLPPNDLIQAYQFAKKLDPAHPFFIAASETRNDVFFFRATDIIAPDGYPMNSAGPATKDTANINRWFRPAMVQGKPYPWIVIMIAHWDKGRWNRFPSEKHLRTLSFLGLTENLKGLAFYADRNYAERAPEFWNNVLRKTLHAIQHLTPDILESEAVVSDKVKVSSNVIKYILHKVAGKDYYLLITANPAEDMAKPLSVGKVTFSFDGIPVKRIEAIDEDCSGMPSLGNKRNVELNSGKNSFSDNFWEYDAHAYRIYVK